MATVETVKGAIDVSALGKTLMHEHVFVLSPEVALNFGHEWWDEEARVEDAIAKLTALKAVGIDTIVDATAIGLGRYVPRVARVNAAVDLNIIAATGLYTHDQIPPMYNFRGPGTLLGGPDPLLEMFVRDIVEGIGDTGIKAAFLKCVVEERGLTPDQLKVHQAVSRAHCETGAPITVHTNSEHQTGRLALDLYRKEGVDLTKVVIGHAGDTNDTDYLKWIMDQGAMIGCDRFGLDLQNTTDERVKTVASLCEQGYADRIALGHDHSCFFDTFARPQDRDKLTEIAPDWSFLHISKNVIPALLHSGVTEQQVTLMLEDNPRRYFTTEQA